MATERGLQLAKKLWEFEPHSPGQRDWMLCNAKVKVASCGRRWGKSVSEGVETALYALEHPNTTQIVIAPTDDQTTIIMQEVSRRLHAVPGLSACFVERFAPYHSIRFRDGAGLTLPTTIMARTAGPTGKGLRGHKAHRVVVDERAFVPDEVMERVVTPLLADYDGELVQISTPDGRNGFHRDWLLGQDLSQDRYRSFQFPTSSNPYIPRSYLEHEERNRPASVWLQEYLAQFLEGEGLVFRRVLEAAIEPLHLARYPGQFVMGVDWGRSNDFTVLAVVDVRRRAVVDIDRFTGIGWELQRGRLVNMILKWGVESVLAEANSMGGPNIERLQAEGWPIQAWTATNATKTALIERLALDIENGPLTYPDDPVLLAELQAYAFDKLPSGLIRYGAPCFLPGTKILHSDGYPLPIERLKCKYAVITHTGEAHEVTDVMSRPYAGDIVEIKASGVPDVIRATPEHPFWAKRRTVKNLQRRAIRREFPAEWVEAGDLQIGDWLAVPKRKNLVPSELTDEQLYALGFWLAEGHLTRDWTGKALRGIGLTCCEASYIDRSSGVIGRMFPVDQVKRGNQFVGFQLRDTPALSTRRVRVRKNSRPAVEWELASRPAAEWFCRMLGERSHSKRLHPEIFNRSGLLPLVAGFIDGDGSQRSGQQGDVNVYTTSESLAWQMRQILIDGGIWCTLRRAERSAFYSSRSEKTVESPSPQWILTIKASFLHLLPPCKVRVVTRRHLRHVQEDADYFYTPIRSITRHHYEGPVHNLSVDADESYVAGGVAVHNCGMHDDMVIALGLANLAASDPTPGMAAGEERDWGRVVQSGIPSMMPSGNSLPGIGITGGLRLGV